jgi:hypothetical protein
MAKKTTRTDQVKLVLERLLRDKEVQGQLHTAAARLQEATARARSRRPSKAAGDKLVYAKLREAAVSLTQAGRSLRARPEPKRRGRKVAAAAGAGAVAGGAAVALKKRGNRTSVQPAKSVTDEVPAAPTPMPPPVGG